MACNRAATLAQWAASSGLVIAGLTVIPVINLLVPVVATAFMVHIFHRLPVFAG